MTEFAKPSQSRSKTVLVEMERFAAVRERRGEAAMTEEIRLTGNFVGAMFVHDRQSRPSILNFTLMRCWRMRPGARTGCSGSR